MGLLHTTSFAGSVYDESGYSNDGVAYGTNLTADRFGQNAHAYEFDGIDDYIEIPSSASLDTRYSISMFAWVDSEGEAGPIINYLSNGYGVHFYETRNTTGNELFFRIVKRDYVFTDAVQRNDVLTPV
jgi:hypothetical protein